MAKRGPREFPWFRTYVDVTRDLKLRLEPVTTRWTWIAVLVLARRSPQPGRLLLSDGVRVTVDLVADEAHVTVKAARAALATFTQKEMLHTDPDGVQVVTKWRKRQPESDRKPAGNTPEINGEFPVQLYEETDTEGPTDLTEVEPEGETDTPSTSEHPAPLPAVEPGGTPSVSAPRSSKALAVRSALELEFEQWWATYPRREGKHAAEESYSRRRKAGRSPEALLSAASFLAEWVDRDHIEHEYTPLATTFLNQRRDLEWEHEIPKPPRTNGASRNGKPESPSDQSARILAKHGVTV